MPESSKPLIYLLNLENTVQDVLSAKKFNVHSKKMNGYKRYNFTYNLALQIPYRNEIPLDIHEAEVVVIDTTSKNYFIPSPNNGFGFYYKDTPYLVDLLPMDVMFASQNIFSTNRKQLLIFFASEYTSATYRAVSDGQLGQTIEADSLWIPHSQFSVINRAGRRIHISQGEFEKEIKTCLGKYLAEASYSLVIRRFVNDNVLAVDDSNEPVSVLRRIGEKYVMVLPDIKNKDEFLCELFSKVLPEHKDLGSLFPENDNFSWTHDFSYISIEERNKILAIEEELKSHEEKLASLKEEYESVHNKEENVKLRNILKETDDELVFSVAWFFDYLGFQNIETPDDEVVVDEGDVFEEDLRVITDEMTLLFEVKGIGGTSTDANCAQISKIVNRRRKADRTKLYHGVYIVNHQRYKAPKERERIPFNERQIEDAEIANRGMTFTYELFHVYHMIEAGILTKEAVREAFKQEGLINFRESLCSLTFNHCYKKPIVYSLIMEQQEGIVMTRNDKIAIQDNEEHWHLLTIEGLQIDSVDYEEVSNGTIGIKVDRLVPGARDFYLVKA
ncbi:MULTISPECIES: hypothetical protein [Pantoea]|jgi:glutaredoxin-related protein|uniref:Uncharacterized protein n=1 Tax=Pantoea brenneri TaxID=472694 RepID=A0A7Y6NIM7_9GAMM|nr:MULTISPECIES: hypothetical protein [Pantoea]MBZ6397555.1 hypothetical protein [Pantoea sp.]MBZ6440704.1 hypothetical protein [Pantoea sp.]NUY44190.1 hypothetical protein [Pantoea brenneri]NUY51651.1 hypothetical protein [Pantoea brenneri]NUY61945.1 hypothetical protein [Pantoea brenneri]